MTYDRESYGERSRDRLGEESVSGEIEEEPSDLDQPEGLFEDDDDLGDLEIDGEELDDEGEESDEDAEPASPLAEDAPPRRARGKEKAAGRTAEELEEEERGYELASSIEDEDELEGSPGVRTTGGTDVAVMSQSDRRREFPSVARASRGPGKRKESGRGVAGRRGRRRKPARA